MWPLDRRRSLLRISRERVERWQPQRGLWLLQDQRQIEAPESAALHAAVASLCAGAAAAYDLVVESAWLPVLLVPCGRSLWSRRQVEPLLRHRLGLLYGDAADPVAQWQLELDHRPGDARCLGYGLSAATHEALSRAALAAACRWSSLQPAWTWGARRFGVRDGWWAWMEQDRALLGCFIRGQVVALNAALPADVPDWTRAAEVEALRCGLAAGPVTVAGWHETERRDRTSAWRAVAPALATQAKAAT